jgi:hypothetical protein
MVDELTQDIVNAAANAVEMCLSRDGRRLDYSESSLAILEEMLAEAADLTAEMTPDQLTTLVQDFGCYVLEVGRKEFGGRSCWFPQREQPVLVVGEPACRIALLAWDKVRGRLSGDKADNILFFYAGFAERARRAEPGDDVLYV